VVVAVLEQRNLCVDVVNGINNIVGLVSVLPWRQQVRGDTGLELLETLVELDPRRDGDEAAVEALHLGNADVGKGGDGVAVEGAQGNLVEIDETDLGNAGTGERGGAMGANAAAADDDDEGFPELLEALVLQEDAVARQLLQDEFVVKVAQLGPLCKSLVVCIFLVGG
jgi:hypothetical protein